MHTPLPVRVRSQAQRGFTLVELMVTVSIAGILSGVALPSFESQLQKARRTDVLLASALVQATQERFRVNATSYGSLAEIGMPARTASGHYTLQIVAHDADGYELLAAAAGAQQRDAACRYMKMTAIGLNVGYASGPDATVANPADANRKCWAL